MLKKIYNTIFIVLFLAVLAMPLVLTRWESGGVSQDENRTLAAFPSVQVEGAWNEKFTAQFETWFMDHLGLRSELIGANAKLQHTVFNRLLSNSNYHIGPHGDLNYADEAMIKDYAHANLRSEYWVGQIGDAYQTAADYLQGQEIPFFYIQCYDKHSIYPEQFTTAVKQLGDISKTDQIITYLQESTTVNVIDLKPVLLDAKAHYEVYSNWGDPTHWSERGAYVAYLHIMEQLNATLGTQLKVLQEQDYTITVEDKAMTLNNVLHVEDMLEVFTIRDPQAQRQDNSIMGPWQDRDHTVLKNPNAGNDLKLLLLCDSYFNSYLLDDLAESFSEVWLIWADHMIDLPEILQIYDADLVILENAERVDRSGQMRNLQAKLQSLQGWFLEDGKWYYYEAGVKKTGWLLEGDAWYYLEPQMVTGSRTIDGKAYEFDGKGVCLNP